MTAVEKGPRSGPYGGWRKLGDLWCLGYTRPSVLAITTSIAMNQDALPQRITTRPDVFGGKPIVRDLRISVELVLSLLAQGESYSLAFSASCSRVSSMPA
jgi:hypothetical protein